MNDSCNMSSWSPTGVVEALVVDDHAIELAGNLNANSHYAGAFHFDAIELKAGAKFLENACAAFRSIHAKRKSYGFALLGLRFGEAEGTDLLGYQILPMLKRFFPRLPVIVCSLHDDMGMLARAFRNGAKWFLRKAEIPKLPEILHSLLTRREWEPEWRTITSLGLIEFDFEEKCKNNDFMQRFDEKRRYLTYKCFEKFPGHIIRIYPMGGGFSTAVTFRAVKKTGNGAPLQMPLVVKIDTLVNTQMEYERYFRFIRPYIYNDAGRVENPERVIDLQHAAIAYTFAGTDSGDSQLSDMKSLLDIELAKVNNCDFKRIRPVFDDLFKTILPRLHRVSPDIELGVLSSQTSYPNPELGEVSKSAFIANWISRISVRRQIKDVEFECQSDKSLKKDLIGFEYFTSYDCGSYCVIEAFDNDKTIVVLTGSAVDDVVRNRSHGLRSGAMLWIDNNRYHYYEKDIQGGCRCLYSLGCEDSLFSIMEKPIPSYLLLPELVERAGRLVGNDIGCRRFTCPVGIVHGDLNFANVMVESRRVSGHRRNISDIWLIDFARTRRDLIVHDFVVMFAAAIWLLDVDLSEMIIEVVFARENRQSFKCEDRRVCFISSLLGYIRKAAFSAGVSQDMFALAVALSLMMTFRIAFHYGGCYKAAEGMLRAANQIIDILEGEKCR